MNPELLHHLRHGHPLQRGLHGVRFTGRAVSRIATGGWLGALAMAWLIAVAPLPATLALWAPTHPQASTSPVDDPCFHYGLRESLGDPDAVAKRALQLDAGAPPMVFEQGAELLHSKNVDAVQTLRTLADAPLSTPPTDASLATARAELSDAFVAARRHVHARHPVAALPLDAGIPPLLLPWLSVAMGLAGTLLLLGLWHRPRRPLHVEASAAGLQVDDHHYPRHQLASVTIEDRRLRLRTHEGTETWSRPVHDDDVRHLHELVVAYVAEGARRPVLEPLGSADDVPAALRAVVARPVASHR